MKGGENMENKKMTLLERLRNWQKKLNEDKVDLGMI